MSDATGHDVPPILDRAFDSATLPTLRAEVHDRARQAGMPEGRAGDMVLAIHELAANAVRHGTGAGRLRVWNLCGALHCQVDDGSPPASGGPAGQRAGHARGAATAPADASGQAPMYSWPDRPGHGLWVVRQVSDRLQVLSGPGGTRASVTFALPSGLATCHP
jgi:two-component sensor histidine kinase